MYVYQTYSIAHITYNPYFSFLFVSMGCHKYIQKLIDKMHYDASQVTVVDTT